MTGSTSESPVRDLLATMTAESVAASSLDENSLMLVRIAALVAVDAQTVSYLLNLDAASEIGIDAEQGPRCPPAAVATGSSARRGVAGPPPARSYEALAVEIEIAESAEANAQ